MGWILAGSRSRRGLVGSWLDGSDRGSVARGSDLEMVLARDLSSVLDGLARSQLIKIESKSKSHNFFFNCEIQNSNFFFSLTGQCQFFLFFIFLFFLLFFF